MKIFRWQGLVFVISIAGLISIFFLFFFDKILKSIFENSLERVLKKPVEIESVKTRLSSLEFSVKNIKVADKKNPYINLVQIERINFNLSSKKLAFKKYEIENLTFENVRFNTKRKEPISFKKVKKEEKEKSLEKKSIDVESFTEKLRIPSVKEILSREKLKTVETGKTYEEKFKSVLQKWEKNYEEIKKEEESLKKIKSELKALEKRAKNIKSPEDINEVLKLVRKLKQEINQKVKNIKSLKEEIEKDSKVVKNAYFDLNKAYKEDLNYLKSKYTFDTKGAIHISGLIFGKKIENFLSKGISVYKALTPYIKKGEEKQSTIEERGYRLEGRYVVYREKNPYPDLVVKHGSVSIQALDSKIKGTFKDFSDNQKIYGKPFTMSFSASESKYFKNFMFRVVLDRTKQISIDKFNLSIDDFKLKDFEIMDLVRFKDNLLNIKTDIKVFGEKEISGLIKLIFKRTKPVVNKENKTKIITELFKDIRNFYITANVSGSIDSPKVEVKSDLDEKLSSRLKAIIEEKSKELERKLSEELSKYKAKYMSEFKNYNEEFSKYRNIIKTYENQYMSYLKKLDEKYGKKALKKKLKESFLKNLKIKF